MFAQIINSQRNTLNANPEIAAEHRECQRLHRQFFRPGRNFLPSFREGVDAAEALAAVERIAAFNSRAEDINGNLILTIPTAEEIEALRAREA